MTMRTYFFAATLALFSAASTAAPAVTEDHAQSTAEILQVVETFKAAIIKHDGQSLKQLFLQDQGNWLSVMHENLYQKVHARHPELARIQQSNYAEFSDFVTNAKTPVEEKFNNVIIETNGTIGTVYFDFDFLDDGKIRNRGSETWQLIKTENGWKIAAMLYSSAGG
jgi:hypothetical protein